MRGECQKDDNVDVLSSSLSALSGGQLRQPSSMHSTVPRKIKSVSYYCSIKFGVLEHVIHVKSLFFCL